MPPPQRVLFKNIFIKGLEGKTITLVECVYQDTKVSELLDIVSDRTGVPVDEIRLICGSKQLSKPAEPSANVTMEHYGVRDLTTMHLVLRLRGGMLNNELPGPVRKLPADAPRSDAACMITLVDEEDDPRAKMECGHALTPDALFTLVKDAMDKGQTAVGCPQHCSREWTWPYVVRAAAMSREEEEMLGRKLAINVLDQDCGVRECPSCKTLCVRSDEHKAQGRLRMACVLCVRKGRAPGQDFCWRCLQPWRGEGVTKCNNAVCSDDPQIQMLQECEIITFEPPADARFPKLRACPRCGTVISSEEGCKHMKCTSKSCQAAKFEFCFMCLKPKLPTGRWACGPPCGACPGGMAERQKEITRND